ncbi:MAG: hypothetical protein [Microviridae sp.]|nr:MAG: hypothetical protein [Microviridae sp.]
MTARQKRLPPRFFSRLPRWGFGHSGSSVVTRVALLVSTLGISSCLRSVNLTIAPEVSVQVVLLHQYCFLPDCRRWNREDIPQICHRWQGICSGM